MAEPALTEAAARCAAAAAEAATLAPRATVRFAVGGPIGGFESYDDALEAVLLTHPDVGDVGVIGIPDAEWGETVLAVVEPPDGLSPDGSLAAELVEWCRARLAHYKCPRRVEFTEELPRHDNGKLYKQVLREQYRARSATTGGDT